VTDYKYYNKMTQSTVKNGRFVKFKLPFTTKKQSVAAALISVHCE